MSGKKGMKWSKAKATPYKQKELLQLSQDYLRNNFHKFSDATKLKISLTIASK